MTRDDPTAAHNARVGWFRRLAAHGDDAAHLAAIATRTALRVAIATGDDAGATWHAGTLAGLCHVTDHYDHDHGSGWHHAMHHAIAATWPSAAASLHGVHLEAESRSPMRGRAHMGTSAYEDAARWLASRNDPRDPTQPCRFTVAQPDGDVHVTYDPDRYSAVHFEYRADGPRRWSSTGYRSDFAGSCGDAGRAHLATLPPPIEWAAARLAALAANERPARIDPPQQRRTRRPRPAVAPPAPPRQDTPAWAAGGSGPSVDALRAQQDDRAPRKAARAQRDLFADDTLTLF